MTCETHKHLDWNNIIRSVAAAAVALPVSIALAGQLGATTRITDAIQEKTTETAADAIIAEHRDALTKACIDYQLSAVDTKLERAAIPQRHFQMIFVNGLLI